MELAIQYNDVFPTRIWQAELQQLGPHLTGWLKEVNAMRAAAPEPAGRSNRLGWNSLDKAVLERPAFKALQQMIRVCCDAALEQMGIAGTPFVLESWVNIHDRGGFNFGHIHDGSLLSGSVYLQVPKGSGDLVLRDPRPRTAAAFLPAGVANAISDLYLEPRVGLAILFPYWLEHQVEPHGSDTPRIAIAFNALKA